MDNKKIEKLRSNQSSRNDLKHSQLKTNLLESNISTWSSCKILQELGLYLACSCENSLMKRMLSVWWACYHHEPVKRLNLILWSVHSQRPWFFDTSELVGCRLRSTLPWGCEGCDIPSKNGMWCECVSRLLRETSPRPFLPHSTNKVSAPDWSLSLWYILFTCLYV